MILFYFFPPCYVLYQNKLIFCSILHVFFFFFLFAHLYFFFHLIYLFIFFSLAILHIANKLLLSIVSYFCVLHISLLTNLFLYASYCYYCVHFVYQNMLKNLRNYYSYYTVSFFRLSSMCCLICINQYTHHDFQSLHICFYCIVYLLNCVFVL